MKEFIYSLSGMVMLATLFAGFVNLWQFGERVRMGREAVASERRQLVPWGLVDFLAVIFLMAAGGVFLGICLTWAFPELKQAAAGSAQIPIDAMTGLTVADSLLKVAVFLAAVALISWRVAATPHDWGWSDTKWWPDFWLGCKAASVLIPVVLILQYSMISLTGWESKHPLIESLRQAPMTKMYIVSFIAAVVVAPIVEEWAFRVLLQGWLEKVATRQFSWEQLLLGNSSTEQAIASTIDSNEKSFRSTAEGPTVISNVPQQETAHTEAMTSYDPGEPTRQQRLLGESGRPFWPIVVSAALFAGVHISHGPDFVPLFFFSLGLGYLYRQTHRIVPSMTVHLLLNLFSMLNLGVYLWLGEG